MPDATYFGQRPERSNGMVFVDTEQTLVDQVKRMLQHVGHDVTLRISGREAFQKGIDNELTVFGRDGNA